MNEKRPYLNTLCRRGPRCLALFNESPPADGHNERDDTHQDNVLQIPLESLGTPGIGRHGGIASPFGTYNVSNSKHLTAVNN